MKNKTDSATAEIDFLLDTLECPVCKSELADKWSATQRISWIECTACEYEHVYEQG